jgi:hypothetical protein
VQHLPITRPKPRVAPLTHENITEASNPNRIGASHADGDNLVCLLNSCSWLKLANDNDRK